MWNKAQHTANLESPSIHFILNSITPGVFFLFISNGNEPCAQLSFTHNHSAAVVVQLLEMAYYENVVKSV